ncbi:MAG TPA: FAD-dependent oxidoreductase [Pirellulales bacterium]|jgi:hypothetical protein|nr:FAD-dependent oxidoreductase [Pirellulales bacterium]
MKSKSCLLIALVGALGGVSVAAETERADVVVVAATPAGVAAAVAAARSGASVILVEEGQHVGGIVAGGLTNTDIRKHAAVGGLYNEFKRRVREHYVRTYGHDSEQVRLCRDGNRFEPKVAEMVFRQLLAGEERIRLVERQRLVAARVLAAVSDDDDIVGGADRIERNAAPGRRIDGAPPKEFGPAARLVSIVAQDLSAGGKRTEFRARVFIDATYEGDLAALAGVPYRVGRESRQTFGEPHAGNIYVRFGDHNPLPGSTGEADGGIQAFCFRFHLTRDKDNAVPIEQPEGYRRDDYRALLADVAAGKITRLDQVIQFYPMPNGKFEINSDHAHPNTGVPSESLDLAEENWGWPEAGPEERERLFARYWSYNEGLMWLLLQDESVPQAIRNEAQQWGFPKDEFVDHRHRPHHIYVRQGRRIWGDYNFTERDADRDFATGLPKRKPDGVAVAEFEFDSHAVHKFDDAHPGVREGYFFVDHEPLQLPYRICVPKCVDGLLVPVACSASHVGYQTIRMEPVFMALGEACGIAAQIAQPTRGDVRTIDAAALQREILRRGGVVLYECAPLRPDGL